MATEIYSPNPLLRWLYRRFFSHIQLDPRWTGAVEDASERGVVVYVMRTISFLDFVCLDFLTKKLGLPLIRFVNDLGLSALEPSGIGERRLRLRRKPPEPGALVSVVDAGHSALLFLRDRAPMSRSRHDKGAPLDSDLILTLVQLQR